MTCIVAVTNGVDVCMGGDSAGAIGNDVTVRIDPKIFKNKDLLFGCTGSFRMG